MVRDIPYDDGARSDDGVAADGNAIRNACSNSYRRAFSDFHEPSGKNSRSEAGKILHFAIVVSGTASIEDAERTDS
jgi:hypothetical protein